MGGRGRVYTYRYTVTTRMTCIKMCSDESHFNVSLIVRDKVTRQCPQTTIFLIERRAEAVSSQGLSAYQPTALPLGQTGFNTLGNWGHETPTQSKRKRTGKKRLKGHGPEHVYNTLGYTCLLAYLSYPLRPFGFCSKGEPLRWLLSHYTVNLLQTPLTFLTP